MTHHQGFTSVQRGERAKSERASPIFVQKPSLLHRLSDSSRFSAQADEGPMHDREAHQENSHSTRKFSIKALQLWASSGNDNQRACAARNVAGISEVVLRFDRFGGRGCYVSACRPTFVTLVLARLRPPRVLASRLSSTSPSPLSCPPPRHPLSSPFSIGVNNKASKDVLTQDDDHDSVYGGRGLNNLKAESSEGSDFGDEHEAADTARHPGVESVLLLHPSNPIRPDPKPYTLNP